MTITITIRDDHDLPPGVRCRPIHELRTCGLLWLINTTVFCPRGYALALVADHNGHVLGWYLRGDGAHPYRLDDTSSTAAFAAAAAELGTAATPRPELEPEHTAHDILAAARDAATQPAADLSDGERWRIVHAALADAKARDLTPLTGLLSALTTLEDLAAAPGPATADEQLHAQILATTTATERWHTKRELAGLRERDQ